MGDMRISMLVEMKAAAARAEAAGLRGEIDKLGTGAATAGQATGRAATNVIQLATASTSATSAVTQQTSALQQMIAVSTGLASATQSSVAAELAHGRALDETRARGLIRCLLPAVAMRWNCWRLPMRSAMAR